MKFIYLKKPAYTSVVPWRPCERRMRFTVNRMRSDGRERRERGRKTDYRLTWRTAPTRRSDRAPRTGTRLPLSPDIPWAATTSRSDRRWRWTRCPCRVSFCPLRWWPHTCRTSKSVNNGPANAHARALV